MNIIPKSYFTLYIKNDEVSNTILFKDTGKKKQLQKQRRAELNRLIEHNEKRANLQNTIKTVEAKRKEAEETRNADFGKQLKHLQQHKKNMSSI